MFKKMTAILMVAAMTNAYAVTPVKQSFDQAAELKKTYDELNYKLNVEWDQQDGNFRDNALQSFEQQLASLQKRGLTGQALVNYTMEQMKDQQTRDDIIATAKLIHDNKLNPEEARAFALSKVNGMYAQGASWSGSRMRIHAVLMVAAIILIVCALSSHDDSTTVTHGDNGGGDHGGGDHGGGDHGGDDHGGDDHGGGDHGGDDHGGNNGHGNGDQDAPGGSCEHNNAENAGCVA